MKKKLPVCLALMSTLTLAACGGKSSKSGGDDQPKLTPSGEVLPLHPIDRSETIAKSINDLKSEFEILPKTVQARKTPSKYSKMKFLHDAQVFAVNTDSDDETGDAEGWHFGEEGVHDCSDASGLIDHVFNSLEKGSLEKVQELLAEGSKADNEEKIFEKALAYLEADSEEVEVDEGDVDSEGDINSGDFVPNLEDILKVKSLASESSSLELAGTLKEDSVYGAFDMSLNIKAGNNDNGIYAEIANTSSVSIAFSMGTYSLKGVGPSVNITDSLHSMFNADAVGQVFKKEIKLNSTTTAEADGEKYATDIDVEFSVEVGKGEGAPYLKFLRKSQIIATGESNETEETPYVEESFKLIKTGDHEIVVEYETHVDEKESFKYNSVITVDEDESCKMVVGKSE